MEVIYCRYVDYFPVVEHCQMLSGLVFSLAPSGGAGGGASEALS